VSGRPAVGLRRFVEGQGRPRPVPDPEPERCELCGTEVDERHGHLVDAQAHQLVCACRACYLLFTREHAGERYRAVPERYAVAAAMTAADWEDLGIPVSTAFFLRSRDGVTAWYPSPAGATECLLNLAAWDRLTERQPMLAAVEPDVEAILVRRTDEDMECYLVPVDACYRLVGTVRMWWRGFDGGTEARDRIDEFFATVRARARPFAPET
jgi:hypothetical protein